VNQSEAVEAALGAFPKLYYFVPRLAPFSISIPEANREELARVLKKPIKKVATIKIEEPLDTILWLMETLSPEHHDDYCRQHDVVGLVSRWTKVTFSREIAKLYAAELIEGGAQKRGDHRFHELKLTERGKRILNKIKDDRRKVLHSLFKNLGPTRTRNVAGGLREVAKATWPVMKTEAHASRKSRHKKRSPEK
jgi:hypothetical protein